MAKSVSSKLEPREFGDFTRDRLVGIPKKAVGVESPAFVPIRPCVDKTIRAKYDSHNLT